MSQSTSLGAIGYQAYGEAAQWKAYNGSPMPQWQDLRQDIRDKWEIAALAIEHACKTHGDA